MPVGLSIGKLVFGALNKVEWGLTIIIGISLFFYTSGIRSLLINFFIIIVAILIMQTTLFLPALNKRAKAIIAGKTLPPSDLHWYYVSAEFIKLLLEVKFNPY